MLLVWYIFKELLLHVSNVVCYFSQLLVGLHRQVIELKYNINDIRAQLSLTILIERGSLMLFL